MGVNVVVASIVDWVVLESIGGGLRGNAEMMVAMLVNVI